jgi:hypothetical protein
MKEACITFEFNQNSLNCCGVIEIHDFYYNKSLPEYDDEDNEIGKVSLSGSGLLVATFIDNKTCRGAYEELKKQLILLYQSPVRKNNYSGNKLFLCVYMNPERKFK